MCTYQGFVRILCATEYVPRSETAQKRTAFHYFSGSAKPELNLCAELTTLEPLNIKKESDCEGEKFASALYDVLQQH